VVVGATGHQVEAALCEHLAQPLGVGDDLRGVVAEFWLRGLVQRHRDPRDGVVVRAALQPRKDRPFQRRGVLAAAQQQGAARSSQRLVGGGRDDRRVAHRGGVHPADHQSRDVRDIGYQDGADLVGDLGEPGEVDGARDRGATAEDQLGPLAPRQVPDLVQVDDAGVAPHAILHRVEPFSGDGHVPAVGQVAAHRQRHAHHDVARLAVRQIDGEVRW
jgi:hypothetical protein